MQTTIGITAGDPSGIGLEVVLKAIKPILSSARWIVFTDRFVFEQNLKRLESQPVPHRWIEHPSRISDDPLLWLFDAGNPNFPIVWGCGSAQTGKCALTYLESASHWALQGHIAAVITAPVSKERIGRDFRGQTEFLAGRAGVKQFAMSFFAPTFKVVLATTHVPLLEAIRGISVERYTELIRFVDGELRRFGFESRRIAVSAINPHAGEGGMFGREDLEILKPAVDAFRGSNIVVSGPHPADSLYFRAHSGEFDVVIAPYHDQGLIPIKLIAHGTAANVTLGLPYVRTSPDHGTAFSIAGRGVADPSGMGAALRCALDLAARTRGSVRE